MCGRFTLKTPTQALADLMGFTITQPLPARYNIAPGQMILAVRNEGEQRKGVMLRWGLVPAWAEDESIGNRLINARGESLASKPSFREAYRQRRCLIPADGFYEWQKQGRNKQPYYIHRRDSEPMVFAGLWERWVSSEKPLETCTIITTSANALVRPMHDRMPVIMEKAMWERWLSPQSTPAMLQELLRPAGDEVLTAYPVNTTVNRPAVDDARCLEPMQTPGSLFG